MFTLLELGGVFGLYFFVQAYGYASGLKSAAPVSINESIVLGFQHLTSLLRPWEKVSAPVSPLLCGFLLLVVPYLSDFYAAHEYHLIRSFLALLIAVSLASVVGFGTIGSPLFSSFVELHKTLWGTLGSVALYSWGLVLVTFVSGQLLAAFLPETALAVFWVKPYSLIVTALGLALLYFLTYLSSVFDGVLDRKMLE